MNITTKIRKNPFRLACLGAVMALFSVTSHASLVLTSGAPSQIFSWSFVGTSGSTSYTLQGNGSFTASGFGSSSLALDILLNNTTSVPLGANAGLYSFGFGITPDATSITSFNTISGAGMVDAVMNTGGNTNIPSLTGIEVCAFGALNCSGGSQLSAIAAGSSNEFALTLAGAWGSSVTIDPIGFKYQTTIGSFEFTTGSSSSSSTSSSSTSSSSGGPDLPPTVPEPNNLALLGLGLIASVFALRRRTLQGSALQA